jgi:hypothetical protein
MAISIRKRLSLKHCGWAAEDANLIKLEIFSRFDQKGIEIALNYQGII